MRLLLVGASGYGNEYYLDMLEHVISDGMDQLIGIVDPFIIHAPQYEYLRSRGIPFFDTMEEFYQERKADLVFISSPIALHRQQTETALAHGSFVLCEKPLVPVLQEAKELKRILNGHMEKLGVGFQWSFSHCMLSLKQDILNGLFGRPVSLKTHVSWQRPDSYYTESLWRGRVCDEEGRWILDSILSNATAHYLHNMFFVLGKEPGESAMPAEIRGSVYRGKSIESFDTCFLRGNFPDGTTFYYTASHSGERNSEPRFEYRFEKGTVYFDMERDKCMYGIFKDGKQKNYGEPHGKEGREEKILQMMDAVETGKVPVCNLDTILPHLKVCNGVFDYMPIADFPKEMHFRQKNPGGEWIRGLCEAMDKGYDTMLLPDELGYTWAAPSVTVSLEHIDSFTGRLFDKKEIKEK